MSGQVSPSQFFAHSEVETGHLDLLPIIHPVRTRVCHAFEAKSGIALASMMQMNATKCNPLSVSGKRS